MIATREVVGVSSYESKSSRTENQMIAFNNWRFSMISNKDKATKDFKNEWKWELGIPKH